jgi:hypothetical protein
MKRSLSILSFAAALFCFFHPLPSAAADGEVRFGTGITEDWEIENEGTEFDTNLIACRFYSPEPFGVMSVAFSIYYQAPDEKVEKVLLRADQEVNPDWNAMIFPELPLPSTGKYTFSLAKPSGDMIASGGVTIKEKKVEEALPEQPTAEGKTLEALFNKFKPKN